MSSSNEQEPGRQNPPGGNPDKAPEQEKSKLASFPSRYFETSGLFRFSVTQFLVALILLLITTPFLTGFKQADVITSGFMTLVLISAVLAVGGGGRLLAFTILLVLPALAAAWVDYYEPDLVPRWIITSIGLVFIGFVITQLLRFILRAPHVNAEVLCAGIATYLLLGLLWAAAYSLAARLDPHAFCLLHGAAETGRVGRFDALYFSFVSLTCLGCNDIIPLSRATRMLMVVEATTGVLYLAVMIARLVALYSRPAQGKSEAGKTA